MAHFTTKFNLGDMVYYGDRYNMKKGEILEIKFDGSFNNTPIYTVEYNGNIYAEDELIKMQAIAKEIA